MLLSIVEYTENGHFPRWTSPRTDTSPFQTSGPIHLPACLRTIPPFLIHSFASYWSSQTPLADTFLHVTIVPANAYQHTKFQLSTSISFGDMRGSQNKKWAILYQALLRVNAYRFAKFQLPSCISYGNMEGVPK